MNDENSNLLKTFHDFNATRNFEIETLKKLRFSTDSQERIEYDRFCMRIDQAQSYAELHYYKQEDYFDELQRLFDNGSISNNIPFVAFVVARFGFPQGSHIPGEVHSVADYSPELARWIIQNQKYLHGYDFDFDDFCPALKEAAWRRHQDLVIMLGHSN